MPASAVVRGRFGRIDDAQERKDQQRADGGNVRPPRVAIGNEVRRSGAMPNGAQEEQADDRNCGKGVSVEDRESHDDCKLVHHREPDDAQSEHGDRGIGCAYLAVTELCHEFAQERNRSEDEGERGKGADDREDIEQERRHDVRAVAVDDVVGEHTTPVEIVSDEGNVRIQQVCQRQPGNGDASNQPSERPVKAPGTTSDVGWARHEDDGYEHQAREAQETGAVLEREANRVTVEHARRERLCSGHTRPPVEHQHESDGQHGREHQCSAESLAIMDGREHPERAGDDREQRNGRVLADRHGDETGGDAGSKEWHRHRTPAEGDAGQCQGQHLERKAGTSVMNVGASGPQSGHAAIVTASSAAHHFGSRSSRPSHAVASRPPTPTHAQNRRTAVMLRPNTASTGVLMSTWPTSVIDTQLLKSHRPLRSHVKRVRRYDQSSLRGTASAP